MVKKIIVISNSHIDNKNKYFYIFNELKEKKILIDFFTVKEKNKILKLNTKKYTYFIDLLLTPDLSIKNPRYKKLLYNIFKIRKFLKLNNVKSIIFNSPAPNKWDYKFYRYINFLKLFFKIIHQYSLDKIYKQPVSDISLRQSNHSMNLADVYSRKTIFTHTTDYDRTLLNINHINKKYDYGIYIDQMIGEHPDTKLTGFKTNINVKKFNEELDIFFKNFEKKTKIKILYSAHPKRKKTNSQNKKLDFSGTQSLMKNAKIVFAHESAAISYAVIFKKPLVIIQSNNIKTPEYIERSNHIANMLKKKIYNVGDKIKKKDLENIFSVNNIDYNNYINNFCKHPRSKKIKISDTLINIFLNG
tara:strand:- start:2407 stop:3483 length:1077 start_codon:yes stop_codon:yes gene_type:complete